MLGFGKKEKAAQKEASSARMMSAIREDDARKAIELVRGEMGFDPIKTWGMHAGVDSLLLCVRWGAPKTFEALAAEIGRAKKRDLLKKPELVEEACLQGQRAMGERLVELGAPPPSLDQARRLLERARGSDGRRMRNKEGIREMRRAELGYGSGPTWGEVLTPTFEWIVKSAPREDGFQDKLDAMLANAGNGERARALVEAGAQASWRSANGWSALAHAINSGRRDWMDAIIDAGADLGSVAPKEDVVAFAKRVGRSETVAWATAALRQSLSGAVGEEALPSKKAARL